MCGCADGTLNDSCCQVGYLDVRPETYKTDKDATYAELTEIRDYCVVLK